jgi:hypothetical protein
MRNFYDSTTSTYQYAIHTNTVLMAMHWTNE